MTFRRRNAAGSFDEIRYIPLSGESQADSGRSHLKGGGLLVRLSAYLATAVFLGLTLMFSVLAFFMLALAGLLAGGYIAYWGWKIRRLGRQQAAQMREGARYDHSPSPEGRETSASGVVIEGEAVRVDRLHRRQDDA